MRIWNRSKQVFQDAKQELCPRCRGYGQVTGDGEPCLFCEGVGEMWMSTTDGYYVPLRITDPKETIFSKRW